VALKKGEKRLLGLLGVVLIIFLLDRFVLGGDKKAKTAVPPKAAVKGAVNVPGVNAAVPKKAAEGNSARVIFKSWKKDPFAYSYANELKKKDTRGRPGVVNRSTQPNQQVQKTQQPAVKKEEKKGPVLNGILWKDGKGFALIDGIIMEEGEEREGLEVLKIRGSKVICRKGNRTFTLEWRESQ